MPISEHRYRRRVEFADTDMAGVAHFSWIVRYMEEAEHALWRAAGVSIVPADRSIGFPRVALAVNFKAPVFFEDEIEVLVQVTAISPRSMSYSHLITRGETIVATGTMTAVCTRKQPDGSLKATEIPTAIAERFKVHG